MDKHRVKFVDLTHDGKGVCKLDGYPVFVDYALKGEVADIVITKRRKTFGFGRLVEVIEPSPFRKEPLCEYYELCGGCQIMHMHYQTQLDYKQYRTQETLKRLGGLEVTVKPPLAMKNPFYYRHKVVVFFSQKGKTIRAGFHKASSHEVVDIKKCVISQKRLFDVVKVLKSLAQEGLIDVQEDHQPAFLKAAMIRLSKADQSLSLTLITHPQKWPQKKLFVEAIIKRCPELKTIVWNIQPLNKGPHLGPKSHVLYGEDVLYETLGSIQYRLTHDAFFQVNPEQMDTILDNILTHADLRETDRVLDAYCGLGAIGLNLAHKVHSVLGVDITKAAIDNAKKAAKDAGITHARFLCGSVETVMAKARGAFDVVVLDPPRKGADERFLEQLVALSPRLVIYVSCNVATLARDLKYLVSEGYHISYVQPVDMFAQTAHIETVTILSLNTA